MSRKPIYFDYMATTPVDPRVIEVMLQYLGPNSEFGNPSSSKHIYGQKAAKAVEYARQQIATAINSQVEEIVFTSGATEANNLAILGAARFYQHKGKHLITMSIEHDSVLDSFKQLEREGFKVSYLNPKQDGLLDLEILKNAIQADTILVSIMQVNNEIGVIQDIKSIGELLKGKGIIFHVDAAQSAGRLKIDVKKLGVDLMSLSAHKNYGPKGVGALFIKQKPRIRIQALSFGGGHEQGLRSGTLPTHQIAGMGMAFELSEQIREQEQQRFLTFRNLLWNGIKHLPGITLNGSLEHRIAGNLNFSFKSVDGVDLLPTLSELALSSTSACSTSSLQPSHVLKGIGLSADLAKSSIRLSFGRFTTEEEIMAAIEIICRKISGIIKS